MNYSVFCFILEDYQLNLPNITTSKLECIVSGDCSNDLTCINHECNDPCRNSCGLGASCHVVSHVPMCSCRQNFTGNPFKQCDPIIGS